MTGAASKILRKREEDSIQAGIVEYLRTVLPAARYRVFAIPNGGARSKAEAGRMKATGTLAGVFDVCILGPGGASWWLETKTDRGRLSDEQRSFEAFLDAVDASYAIVRSIDHARAALRAWGLEMREAA